MARLTLFEMMNQGLLGAVRRLTGMGSGLSEIVSYLSLKFFGQAPLTVSRAADFALKTMQAAETYQNNGTIAISALPRVQGLPAAFRTIVRVSIYCTEDDGSTKINYATVYVDSNSPQDAEAILNRAKEVQMRKWFSGMGSKPLTSEEVCGEPNAEIIGAMRRRL